jgi:hypothetical protein
MASLGDEKEQVQAAARRGGQRMEGSIGKGTSETSLPRVVSWERTRDASAGRRRQVSPPRRMPAQQVARARSLSREREHVFTGIPQRDTWGSRAYADRHDSSPPRSMSKGGRVNAFAVSPRSPLAGIPRGITAAGVGKMTRRLTVSKSFLRDYFNVEALARGEHGELHLNPPQPPSSHLIPPLDLYFVTSARDPHGRFLQKSKRLLLRTSIGVFQVSCTSAWARWTCGRMPSRSSSAPASVPEIASASYKRYKPWRRRCVSTLTPQTPTLLPLRPNSFARSPSHSAPTNHACAAWLFSLDFRIIKVDVFTTARTVKGLRSCLDLWPFTFQGDNPHAVRYYSAWEEQDVIYIQTELCLANGFVWGWGVGREIQSGRR